MNTLAQLTSGIEADTDQHHPGRVLMDELNNSPMEEMDVQDYIRNFTLVFGIAPVNLPETWGEYDQWCREHRQTYEQMLDDDRASYEEFLSNELSIQQNR